MFCVVLAWSRIRFVRFAGNERAETTLAECFEELGGGPQGRRRVLISPLIIAFLFGGVRGRMTTGRTQDAEEHVALPQAPEQP